MIVLTCPNCYSSHLEKCEGLLEITGNDFFLCKECKTVFPFKDAGHRVEHDIYET